MRERESVSAMSFAASIRRSSTRAGDFCRAAEMTRADSDSPSARMIAACFSCSALSTRKRARSESCGAGGAEGQGAKVLEFRKGWSLPICCLIPAGEGDPCQCPCCCCLPALETYAADGSLVGSTAYLCDAKLFVPKFVVRDHRGADKFLIRPDTCCCDCCVVIRCDLGGRRRASRIMYT